MFAIEVIKPDGSREALNRKITLEEAQQIVGGYIEIPRSKLAHRSLVVNEEGLLIGLPANTEATKLLHPDFDWSKQPGHENFSLVGNVILIKS